MALSTCPITKQDLTVTIADGAQGGFDTSGSLVGTSESFTITQGVGDDSITRPRREVQEFKVRGRTVNPPCIRHGDDSNGSISFSAYFPDLSDATEETLIDILVWCEGYAHTGSYVQDNWESTKVSAVGADDADVNTVSVKFTWTVEGNASNTHSEWWNFVSLSHEHAEGDPDTITVTGVTYARAGTAAHGFS